MHADAVPDADRATLQQPADVAKKLVALVESTVASGARIALPGWQP
jgi:hypothetical protein